MNRPASTKVRLLSFELVPGETMPWYCFDCKARFQGPCDRSPPDGCSACGSHQVIDINVERLDPAEERAALTLYAAVFGGGLKRRTANIGGGRER